MLNFSFIFYPFFFYFAYICYTYRERRRTDGETDFFFKKNSRSFAGSKARYAYEEFLENVDVKGLRASDEEFDEYNRHGGPEGS